MKNEEVIRNIGRRIALLRKERGLSQEALAEKLEKTTNTVSNIERGVNPATIDTYIDIAQALNVPITELFNIAPTSLDKVFVEQLGSINDLMKSGSKAERDKLIKIVELALGMRKS